MSDHPADIHDGPDPAPVPEPEPIEPGHIVETGDAIIGASTTVPAGTRGTVQATTDRTAVVLFVVPVTFEVTLSDLRRCD